MCEKRLRLLLSVLTITFVLQGCTQTPEPNVGKNSETNQSAQALNSNAQNSGINTSNTVMMNNASVSNGNFVQMGNKKNASKMPEPNVGSGGNDLAIIMKARGQLSSDKDLINNVIVEVKEGNATLTGKVANEEQKRKAEELTKSAEGVKSVKNNLRVSP